MAWRNEKSMCSLRLFCEADSARALAWMVEMDPTAAVIIGPLITAVPKIHWMMKELRRGSDAAPQVHGTWLICGIAPGFNITSHSTSFVKTGNPSSNCLGFEQRVSRTEQSIQAIG
ncbi:predicted protein [Coccidioides posadasii str. Silveira]|uniref:Predicted protein n=2 Tax=Coccidioides posadasii TaxID=199306 RepID=E9DEG9_COCPS|nr:predicted protein [Coccidioides posadasii str. Silveira]KMM68804.1 hypothetical protein CPAG_05128 [Coccidioides posadasii RMSCC 3488]